MNKKITTLDATKRIGCKAAHSFPGNPRFRDVPGKVLISTEINQYKYNRKKQV